MATRITTWRHKARSAWKRAGARTRVQPVVPRRLRLGVSIGVACLLTLLVALVIVKVGAAWLASTEGITDPAQRAEELGRARTVVLAILAGGVAVLGAIYTHRNFGLNLQGQITERFTRAVDQLGSASRDVRLGGIYALERLARESQRDHGPIVEILTAYVRERSPLLDEEEEERRLDFDPATYPEAPGADVQAALTVLGRRNTVHDPPAPWRLDLSGAYLPKASLGNANLGRADLSFAVLDLANLRGANLWEAKLLGTRLACADLAHAQLGQANLSQANLREAVLRTVRMPGATMIEARLMRARLEGSFLQGVDLSAADLRHVNLTDANLEGAILIGANLEDALLTRTKLRDAQMYGASMKNARYSRTTIWPDGMDLETSGAVLLKDP